MATAVFAGSMYPAALLGSILRRIRADQEINDLRVSIIKAYLQRQDRLLTNNRLREVLAVSLNTETTNQAYLFGRLFAVLERIQQKAQGDINKTIKDSYFATASASPLAVFPKLIILAGHHLAKLGKEGSKLDSLMGEIIDDVTLFPATLNLEDQGLFILGYYQQRQDLYTKKI